MLMLASVLEISIQYLDNIPIGHKYFVDKISTWT